MGRIQDSCDDCQRLLREVGEEKVYECKWCEHLVEKGEWCTCTKGQLERKVYEELRVLLRKTKKIHISVWDFVQIGSPEALIEYLKDDPTNVEFQYLLIYSATIMDNSMDGAIAFLESNKKEFLTFVEAKWTPEWQEIETIQEVEDKIKWISDA
jgi:hypothetical protein